MYYTVDNQVLDVDIHSSHRHVEKPISENSHVENSDLEEHYASGQACKTDTYTAEKREN